MTDRLILASEKPAPPSRTCRHFTNSEGVAAEVCKRGIAYAAVRQLPANRNRPWLLPCVEADGVAYRCGMCGYEGSAAK